MTVEKESLVKESQWITVISHVAVHILNIQTICLYYKQKEVEFDCFSIYWNEAWTYSL